jgi:hypothetical protein
LTTAACGGLRSTPDCRPRRALLHLSYSYAPPCGPALLVTQCQQPTLLSSSPRRPACKDSAASKLTLKLGHSATNGSSWLNPAHQSGVTIAGGTKSGRSCCASWGERGSIRKPCRPESSRPGDESAAAPKARVPFRRLHLLLPNPESAFECPDAGWATAFQHHRASKPIP